MSPVLRRVKRTGKRLGLTAGVATLRFLPPAWSSALMGAVAARWRDRLIATRKIARNLKIAFPHLPVAEIDALVASVARNFGRVAGELPHLPALKEARRGAQLIMHSAATEAVLADGPAVFVGAHVCNWEIGPVALSMLSRPVINVYSNIGDKLIDATLLKLRKRAASGLTERARAVRSALAAMAQGSNVALLVDQRVTQGHMVPFFGEAALSSHFPARLAIRFARPIIPVWGERIGPVRYAVKFGAPLWADPALAGEEQERELTARVNGALEAIIRARPGEWFCNKTRWPQSVTERVVP